MKNVTISLPDELAHQAKVFAAEHNTSVSRYLGGLLASRIESERGYQKAHQNWQRRALKPLRDPAQAYPKREDVYER
jgi:hypothetical protein